MGRQFALQYAAYWEEFDCDHQSLVDVEGGAQRNRKGGEASVRDYEFHMLLKSNKALVFSLGFLLKNVPIMVVP